MSSACKEVNRSSRALWILLFLCMLLFFLFSMVEGKRKDPQEEANWKLGKFDETITRLSMQMFRAHLGRAQSLEVLNRNDEALIALQQACVSFRDSDRSDKDYQKEADTLWRRLYSQKAENAKALGENFAAFPGHEAVALASEAQQRFRHWADQGFCPDSWQPGM